MLVEFVVKLDFKASCGSETTARRILVTSQVFRIINASWLRRCMLPRPKTPSGTHTTADASYQVTEAFIWMYTVSGI